MRVERIGNATLYLGDCLEAERQPVLFMAPQSRPKQLALDPYADGWPDAAANSKGCYDEALRAIREQNRQ